MLAENIKNIRKQKGMTQEELAVRLNVVRQTVSKWEKGLSVPDADLLSRLAEVLETNVETLLGTGFSVAETDSNAIAEQLARINEQLATRSLRSKKIMRIIVAVILGVLVFYLVLAMFGMTVFINERTDSDVKQYETNAFDNSKEYTERIFFV